MEEIFQPKLIYPQSKNEFSLPVPIKATAIAEPNDLMKVDGRVESYAKHANKPARVLIT